MKAVIHAHKEGFEGLHFGEIEESVPGDGEVRVKLNVAGLNHRDLFVLNRHKPTDPPLIIGSDGAGIIDAVGRSVTNVKVGDEVIINPMLGWEKNSEAPPEGFEIVGHPFHGTFAESIVIPAQNAVPKPSYLTWEEAGVLSLSALTAYRALFTRGKVQKGMKVFIPGIGSGVATFLLMFAKAAGADVYVSSRSEDKCAAAIKLGADKAWSNESDWNSQLHGSKVDLVIESVGAATFQRSLNLLRSGGTVVAFGASAGDEISLNLREFFYNQHNLLGSTMGSGEEYREMLQFIEHHQIKPVIDQIFPLDQFSEGFTRMKEASQFGKIGFSTS